MYRLESVPWRSLQWLDMLGFRLITTMPEPRKFWPLFRHPRENIIYLSLYQTLVMTYSSVILCTDNLHNYYSRTCKKPRQMYLPGLLGKIYKVYMTNCPLKRSARP